MGQTPPVGGVWATAWAACGQPEGLSIGLSIRLSITFPEGPSTGKEWGCWGAPASYPQNVALNYRMRIRGKELQDNHYRF